MSSKEQKTAVNPIVIVTLGVVLLAIALILIIFQPNLQALNPNAASGKWNPLMIAFITGLTTGGLSCSRGARRIACKLACTSSRTGLC